MILIGCWIDYDNPNVSKHFMEKVMKDNPQGQGDELTPFYHCKWITIVF